MTDDEFSDSLIDDEPETTADDMRDAWAMLAETSLQGKTINLACRAGDGYDLNATIDKTIPILGVGVLFKIRDTSIIAQEEQEKDFEKERQAILDAAYILITQETLEYAPEFRENSILLPIGGQCLDATGEFQFGGCTCFGMIYL